MTERLIDVPEPVVKMEVLDTAVGLAAFGVVQETARRRAMGSTLTFGMSDPARVTA